VGFVPANPAHINSLGPFLIAQNARNAQNLSIRYKTGTVHDCGFLPDAAFIADRKPEFADGYHVLSISAGVNRRVRNLHASHLPSEV